VPLSKQIVGLTAAAALCLLGPDITLAQTATTRHWDAAVVAGGLFSNPDTPADLVDGGWFRTGTAAVVLGRYWSPHLKTEIELSTSGKSERYISRYAAIPQPIYPPTYGSEQTLQIRQLAATAVWQFLENQWIHPYIQGGVAMDTDRLRIHTWPQSYYNGDPRVPSNRVVLTEERIEGPTTTTVLRAIAGAGAKFYATPQVFFRTDARWTFGRDARHVVVRAGMGLDF
jgi:hypothetical protein